MPRVFAIADLHLSLSGRKPMDVFGELWRDHDRRIAENWDGTVRDEDVVLLPGDLSWARNLSEAEPDLGWIGDRPGRKILLKGNHDSWWGSLNRVRGALPEGCEPLHNDSKQLDGWILVGARGWTAPDDPMAVEGDEKIFRRELERLRLSLADADRRFGTVLPRLAMLHYPPWLVGREPTEVVHLLVQGGVRACVYGHLHGDDHRFALTGNHQGIEFHFVAADAVDFSPVPIALRREGAEGE
jgi:predicted phosphohydrolase